jgi:hypothetical protein
LQLPASAALGDDCRRRRGVQFGADDRSGRDRIEPAGRAEDSTGTFVFDGLSVGVDLTYDVTMSNVNVAPGSIVGLLSAQITGH